MIRDYYDMNNKGPGYVIFIDQSLLSFYLHADGLDESIKLGSWQPATDSQFELVRDTEGNEDKETFLFSA